MTESPFAQVGPILFENGYSPIPIMPGNKVPGIMVGDEWRMFKGWNEFCLERPSQFQVNQWAKWPDAGVGVACGRGLICIDIDQEEIIEPLLAILPVSYVQKKGRKGISLFYQGNTEVIRSKNYRTPDRVGLVDLLAEGKQTVLPPSIHPDTGEPYFWWSDETLLDVGLPALTELPNDIAERIGEVLKAFGYDPDGDRATDPTVADHPDTSSSHTSNFFRKLNEDALARIEAWAPKLNLPKGRFLGRVYRAVAPWRASGSGRAMSRRSANLSISPGGIEDFGTGERFTALNVVMKTLQIPDSELDAAVQWLGGCLGYDFSPNITLTMGPKTLAIIAERERQARGEPSMRSAIEEALTPPPQHEWQPTPAPVAPSSNVPATAVAEPAGELVEEEQGTAPSEPQPSMADLEALCRGIPGLVGELVEWMACSSPSPSRPCALGPALIWVGTIAGRHQAGPTDLRTNLNVVTLAPSGYGKDHARKALQRLAFKSGLHRFLAPENFLSDSALRKTIEQNPVCMSLMDEFGGFIHKIMDRRAGSHQSNMRQMIMQLFTSSNGFYSGAAAAQETAAPIHNPCFSIYGTSTAHDFWPSMSGRGIGDGFLPRWLVLPISGKPLQDQPVTQPYEPPDRIVEACRAVFKLSRKGGNLPDMASQPVVNPRVAEWGGDGLEAHKWYREHFAKCADESAEDCKVLWTRSIEIALRIAHIAAIGINPERPMLTDDLVDWGGRLTELSTKSCIAEMKDRLASSDKQAEYLFVRRLIKEAGPNGITTTSLKQQINGLFDNARYEAIIKQLQDANQVSGRMYTGPRGGRPAFRYFAAA
ncbi:MULTISPECIES: bifunctional DNA primase/polymerase [unclassified Bradyrhizobium]|uniref:bifunctional DNA primase/polymerase n=1 Tax=unclassified Bradyrhizobium TaxID=2631580 RepID=UPI002916DE1F|nr:MULTISPECIES: bifunctional DNA primase/polymerase [unclassified Bradyrhizobium]